MDAGRLAANARPGFGGLARFTALCLLAYVLIYCLESPVRYALYLAHGSNMILARDALIDIPVVLIFLAQVLKGELHPAFKLLILVVAIQGPMLIVNIGTGAFVTFLFGMKLIITAVLGLVAGRSLLLPGRRTFRLMAVLLAVSIAAILAEKLGSNFPWVGIHDTIGGKDVVLSRDWEVADPLFRRVGGFFRLSIAAALGISIIAITVASGFRNRALRLAILAASLGAVVLTTQKGAILALALVMLAMFLPIRPRLVALRVLVIGGAFCSATISFFTYGMDIVQGSGGVASASSFAMRIKLTWPVSWAWLADHGTFPFGTGIGGMGAPLKFLFPSAAAFPDNMFIFMYAYFGIFAVAFYLWFAYGAWRSIRIPPLEAEPALAILAFLLVYGTFISILEDQLGSLYLGASTGLLLTASLVPATNPLMLAVGLRKDNRRVALDQGSMT